MGRLPFPSKQLFILALCRICEPIAFMSIFPYVYYMVRSFNITTNAKELALYVGMVTSAFAFAEFSSGVAWGRISDKIGRKPVLLCGLAGTALSMLVFGFAPNLPIAMLGRALGGLLNGNMGVLQTTVAEIVTVKEHQPRAYTIMPAVWCLGSILGPALGGALAQPSQNYPSLFPQGTIFDRHPFLLPNLVCAIILACGVLVGTLFLEETHEEKKNRRDLGIEAGRWILSHFKSRGSLMVETNTNQRDFINFESLPDDEPPGYLTTEGAPRSSLNQSLHPSAPNRDGRTKFTSSKAASNGVTKAFSKRVVCNIMAFGILAFHSISFDQLMPVFLSEPVSHQPISLPFYFTGGFGYSTKTIGFMLSVQGVYSLICQPFLMPLMVSKFGTLRTFQYAVISWPLLYFVVPYVVLLPLPLQKPAVYACLLSKITLQITAFPSNALLITNSAPSLLVLGTINGVAASTASLARALGPTLIGLVHSWGLSINCAGLAWWASGVICAVGAIESLFMEEVSNGRLDQISEKEEDDATSLEPLMESPMKNTRENIFLPQTKQADVKRPYSELA